MVLRIYKNELYVPVFCVSIDIEVRVRKACFANKQLFFLCQIYKLKNDKMYCMKLHVISHDIGRFVLNV